MEHYSEMKRTLLSLLSFFCLESSLPKHYMSYNWSIFSLVLSLLLTLSTDLLLSGSTESFAIDLGIDCSQGNVKSYCPSMGPSPHPHHQLFHPWSFLVTGNASWSTTSAASLMETGLMSLIGKPTALILAWVHVLLVCFFLLSLFGFWSF